MRCVDNCSYGTAASGMSQAPEAGTFLLIRSGLIGIAGLKKLIRSLSKPKFIHSKQGWPKQPALFCNLLNPKGRGEQRRPCAIPTTCPNGMLVIC